MASGQIVSTEFKTVCLYRDNPWQDYSNPAIAAMLRNEGLLLSRFDRERHPVFFADTAEN